MYDCRGALVDYAATVCEYNQDGLTHKATQVADLCWILLDYGSAVAEGAAIGVKHVLTDMIEHPVQTAAVAFAGEYVLAYQVCKVACDVAGIGITALTDTTKAKNDWNDYIAPINQFIDAIKDEKMTLRQAIQYGTAIAVGWRAQSKVLGGMGKLCKNVKAKAIKFAQENPLIKPQDYMVTPEGILFKATSQPNKNKPYIQIGITPNLNNTIKKAGTIWDNIKPTDRMYEGTKIPKSFEITANNQKFWVCPNSTEHMLEYIRGTIGNHKKIITHNMPMNCQALLTSFAAAVEQVVSKGIQYDTVIRVGCWELMFSMPRKDGLLPAIYHANFNPQSW